jgi:hypothetical protein
LELAPEPPRGTAERSRLRLTKNLAKRACRRRREAQMFAILVQERERNLRRRLDIPLDAERVLVFGESSHWDTNWLRTSEEYFRERIDAVFEAVFAALEREAHRVFAIESVFFLKLYWERRRHRRERLRELLHSGRLRLLGASMTTPDTLLPNTETILRDYLLGQEWLRQNGIALRPRVAYFPDNFGHSPALPTLMQALGIGGIGVTRIDGMFFIGADWKRRSAFPLPGSTAEQLAREHRSLDFVWRSDDGSRVLCHWNAFTYFQGDMLAHAGIMRWMGKTIGVPWRSRRHIARRIAGYTKKFAALAKTPYLFCPIGCDFNAPISDLCALLDRYNREEYPTTGVYALSAGLDDYLDLVACHEAALPVLAADPNPYWMGFYASRPEVKQRPMRIARTLLLAERLAAARPKNESFAHHVRRAWTVLSLSNHHDYITGTSPDRVWHGEQRVWLDDAEAATRQAWACLGCDASQARVDEPGSVEWWREGDQVHVKSEHYAFTLSGRRGGCLTRFVDADGNELLSGLGNDLVVYHDTGGLWRLGHEYGGGWFLPFARASAAPALIEVVEHDRELTLTVTSKLQKQAFRRELVCRQGNPFVRMSVRGKPKKRWTVTCRFETNFTGERLHMDTPGGRIERPAQKHHDPTFWPVPSFCRVTDGANGRRIHVSFDTPGALSLQRDRVLEWIVARNAPKERAFFVLPVLAHPIGGTSSGEQCFDYAVALEPAGAADERAFDVHRRALAAAWLPAHERTAWFSAPSLIHCDDARVTVSAVKHAEDGDGLIVRLCTHERGVGRVSLRAHERPIVSGAIADAREHNLSPLDVRDGRATVAIDAGIVTLRVRLGEVQEQLGLLA